jgi:hypothetical protein
MANTRKPREQQCHEIICVSRLSQNGEKCIDYTYSSNGPVSRLSLISWNVRSQKSTKYQDGQAGNVEELTAQDDHEKAKRAHAGIHYRFSWLRVLVTDRACAPERPPNVCTFIVGRSCIPPFVEST